MTMHGHNMEHEHLRQFGWICLSKALFLFGWIIFFDGHCGR